MKLTIRRLKAGEADLYRSLRLESLREAPEAFATTYEAALGREPESWVTQADGSAAGRDRATFVVIGERPVGLGAIYRDDEGSDEGELIQMWVAPELRGGGVADGLMDALFDWAGANGFGTIRAGVTRENARALRFYESYGFARVDANGGLEGSCLVLRKRGGDELGDPTPEG
jgi:ribosomal protein S18 acetylase RimI-like enzyme